MKMQTTKPQSHSAMSSEDKSSEAAIADQEPLMLCQRVIRNVFQTTLQHSRREHPELDEGPSNA